MFFTRKQCLMNFSSLNKIYTHTKEENKMHRKNLSMSNIFSLHQELQNATEQYEQYLLLEDFVMSELWFRQMELIVEEMKSL
jgi:hypothetical protein